ncbi:MAG: hypothetical protein AAB281_02350 [Actinomycetota bacterium]
MISPNINKTLRENQGELICKWYDNVHGRVAEDFEQTLRSPMAKSVCMKILTGIQDFFCSEDFREHEVLRNVRDVSYNVSYRRAAVGYNLSDIVAESQVFFEAVTKTLLNNVNPANTDEARELLESVVAIHRIQDVSVMGRIAGYFAYDQYHDNEGDAEIAGSSMTA